MVFFLPQCHVPYILRRESESDTKVNRPTSESTTNPHCRNSDKIQPPDLAQTVKISQDMLSDVSPTLLNLPLVACTPIEISTFWLHINRLASAV